MTKKKKKSRIYIIWIVNLCLITAVVAFFVWYESVPDVSPEKVLKTYMAHISNREYEQMYEMIDAGISGNISQEDFVKRNSAIYEGIDVDNMKVHITSYDKEQKEICYETSMDTVAGKVTFENKASFILEKGKYKLIWNDSLIFPELDSTDKVKVSTTSAKRGQIIDRNGHMLAGEGVASSIGVVPGKLENKNDAISQLAELLEMKTEDIEKKLAAKWVKDDSFVPLKTVPKVNELKLMSIEPDQETLAEKDRQEKLLEIPGVKISDITVREYPLGEAAAHLVGYVQNVTAEDLEEHAGEGYTSNSVIGKSGMEGLFEKELKGIGGNQNIDSSRLELVHYFLTLRLLKVGVHFPNVQLHLLQGFGHLFHLQLGRSEDNDTFGCLLGEKTANDTQFLVLIAYISGLHNLFGRFGNGKFHFCRIMQNVLRQLLYLGRHRSRKHNGLTLLRQEFHNLHNVIIKSHIEHTVCFIQNEIGDA